MQQTPDNSSPAPRKAPFLLISVAVLALDQWSKWLVEMHLPYHSVHEIIPGLLNLTHLRNTGVAFGLFASGGAATPWILTLLGLAALAAVGIYFRLASHHQRLLLVSLSLIVGGAVGNLLDRVASGGVTDFVDVYVGVHHWPAFNVADSAITIGIVLMAVESLLPRRAGRDSGSPAGEAGAEAA